MVILKRLYSNTGLFEEVRFHKGINIIQGVYKRSSERDRGGLNGIGKSTLIRLIDFALLSNVSENKHFDVNEYDFLKTHSVTLEFEFEGKSYIVERKFDNPTNPLFGTESSFLKSYNEADLRIALGNIFFEKCSEQLFEKSWFRDLIKFFIKDDLNYNSRTDPLKFFGQHKPKYEIDYYNLYLLGIPNKSILNFDIKEKELRKLRDMKKILIKNLKEDIGINYVEQTTFEIIKIDNKINNLQKIIEGYNFSELNTEIEEKIDSIIVEKTKSINKKRTLKRKLDEYTQSYKIEDEIIPEHITNMYKQVKTIFGEIVKTEINDVLVFRKSLAKNRAQFLNEKISQMKSDIDEISSIISALESERSRLLKVLDEKKALDIIKNTQALLTEERIKKERILSPLSQIKKTENDISNNNHEISQTINNISKEIQDAKENIKRLESIYYEIISTKMPGDDLKNAAFNISYSQNKKSPLTIRIDIPKKYASGSAKFKILAYDLTVFLNILENNAQFPHFLIHDGVFSGIDKKSFLNILNYMDFKYSQLQNFQYIITANKYELVSDDEKDTYGDYDFDLSNSIIATYTDIPEEMIFKREY